MINAMIPIFLPLALLCATPDAKEDPKQLFLKARELQQANGGNNPEGAVALYRKVIAALPDSPEAHLRLSEALMEIYDLAGAHAAAKNASELAPKNAEVTTNLAIIEFAIAKRSPQNVDAAKASLLKATKLSPGDAELWLRLADLCETTQDAPGALAAWLRLANIRPPMQMGDQPVVIAAYERAAFLAYTLQRYNERRESCMALAREPGAQEHHLRWLEELAREQVAQGYLGHAEESFSLLAKQLPEESSVWQNIALVQRQSNRFADAIQSLARAQEISPEPRNTVLQAFCLLNMGELDEASTILQELLYHDPQPLEQGEQQEYARGLLSASLLMLNRPKDLLMMMDSWGDVFENPVISSQRAHALILADEMASARAALKDGIDRHPSQLVFRQAAAVADQVLNDGRNPDNESDGELRALGAEFSAYLSAEFGQWDKCLAAIMEIETYHPTRDIELLLLQSNALESLGRIGEAIEVLRRCQKLDPSHPTVKNNLGYHILVHGGDSQEAAELILGALEQEPENPYYMDSWGWALFKQGQFSEAETILKSAAEKNPLSHEIYKHLGEVMLAMGRAQEAVEQWEKALAFAFPERSSLEDRLGKLKAELARSAVEKINESEDGDDPDFYDEDDGWQP